MFDERAAAERARAGQPDGVPVTSPPWKREVTPPRLALPPGACDAHFHLIGPQRVFPLMAGHPFDHLAIGDATLEERLQVMDVLGFDRGIHVQSMTYGYNCLPLLSSLLRAPERLRGVVAVWPGISDAELDMLERCGVVGARVYRGRESLDDGMIRRLCERGWSVHYSLGGADDAWRQAILGTPGRYVLEHLGMAPAKHGTGGPEFRFVLDCLASGRCWVKLSTRTSAHDQAPFADLLPLTRALIERSPERLLWWSDWPHVPYFRPMVDDTRLVDLVADWTSDPAVQRRIFVDNPAEAFNWPVTERDSRGRLKER